MIALPLWIDDNLFVRGLVKATKAVMGGNSGLDHNRPVDGSPAEHLSIETSQFSTSL